jgi:hypothetical protein
MIGQCGTDWGALDNNNDPAAALLLVLTGYHWPMACDSHMTVTCHKL